MRTYYFYQITNPIGQKYVGKTMMTLTQRMAAHKRDFKVGHKRKLYRSFEEHGYDKHTFELLETVTCHPNQSSILEQIYLWKCIRSEEKKLNTYKPHNRNNPNECLVGLISK
jgi:hypothetical protein